MADRRQGERRKGDRAGPGRRKSDRRIEERKKQRATCELLDGDRTHRGVLRDVSVNGLFVQAALPVDIGKEMEIHITPPPESPSPIIFVRAKVVRKVRIDRRLASVASGGVGLRITAAPPSYYEAFDLPPPSDAEIKSPPKQKPEAGAGSAPRASEPEPNFRLRLGRGPRSRWISVVAESESDAVAQAEKQAGEGWETLEIELIERAATPGR